jgi:hypothetical protein
MLNVLTAQVRAAHLLVRPEEEWDALTDDLWRAYDSKDGDLVEQLCEPYLASWRVVTRNLLAEPLAAAGIKVARPAHPWAIATLERNGIVREPLLCFLDNELPDPWDAAAVDGGLQLQHFNDIMASYESCLKELLSTQSA